jgi:hypothetical protein
MNTLFMLPATYDLTIDSSQNIAMASDPYSLAQDAASAIRTFITEVYYDTTIGIDYFDTILGQTPSIPIMKAAFVAAALTVPEVTAAQVFIQSISGRIVTGQVQITTNNGVTATASF